MPRISSVSCMNILAAAAADGRGVRCLRVMLVALALTGCATRPDPSNPIRLEDGRAYVKPVLAVTDFENRAGFQGQWKLGEGMAELLMAELLECDQVILLERKNLGDVVGEIHRQGESLFRAEGRVQRGRLMNAQYLIRGVVTDFTVIEDSSGWFGLPSFTIFGGGSKARVALNVYIVDVTSGRVLVSAKTEGTASAGGAGARVDYKNVSFGGDAFFRTPLGHATESALGEAVQAVLRGLPGQPWQPMIAEAGGSQAVINGGSNVAMRVGQEFSARGAPREITDPLTGNVIERIAGQVRGRVRVTEVLSTSSHAAVLEGAVNRGDLLE